MHFKTVKAIARHTMSLNVAQYIQSRECITQWVARLKNSTVPPLEAVERLVCLFCFLQDSSSCTQQLLDAFKMAEGYIFLAELLLSLETDLKVDEDSSDGADALRNLVLLVASLTTCGFIELKPTAPTTGNQPGFRLPRPMGRGVSVRNTNAFQDRFKIRVLYHLNEKVIIQYFDLK